MSQSLKNPVLLALLLGTQVVFAQPEDLSGDGIEDGVLEAQMAMVITDQARPQDCLAAVAINKIDGEPRVVSAQGFLIEPGFHSLNGLATLDTTHCSITDVASQINTTADLEFDFEAGQTYYVGYYHKSSTSDERRLVVWKVEQSPPSEQLIPPDQFIQ